MKISNSKINQLIQVYGKLMSIEFDGDFEEASSLAKDYIKLEDSIKAFEKLKDGIVKKHKLNDQEATEEERKLREGKANEEFFSLLSVEHEIDLAPIKKDYLSKIKIKPLEALMLKDLGLVA